MIVDYWWPALLIVVAGTGYGLGFLAGRLETRFRR